MGSERIERDLLILKGYIPRVQQTHTNAMRNKWRAGERRQQLTLRLNRVQVEARPPSVRPRLRHNGSSLLYDVISFGFQFPLLLSTTFSHHLLPPHPPSGSHDSSALFALTSSSSRSRLFWLSLPVYACCTSYLSSRNITRGPLTTLSTEAVEPIIGSGP